MSASRCGSVLPGCRALLMNSPPPLRRRHHHRHRRPLPPGGLPRLPLARHRPSAPRQRLTAPRRASPAPHSPTTPRHTQSRTSAPLVRPLRPPRSPPPHRPLARRPPHRHPPPLPGLPPPHRHRRMTNPSTPDNRPKQATACYLSRRRSPKRVCRGVGVDLHDVAALVAFWARVMDLVSGVVWALSFSGEEFCGA
jgi:hypothetical protein